MIKWALLVSAVLPNEPQKCATLRIGQFTCEYPEVNEETQEYANCNKTGFAEAQCAPIKDAVFL